MGQSTNEVAKFFEDFMKWRIEDTPEFATCIGIHDCDDKLESYSQTGFMKRRDACVKFLEKASELQATASSTDLDNLKLFQLELNQLVEGYEFTWHTAPLSYFEGPQSELIQLVSYMKQDTVEDFDKIISRYNAFSKQAEEMIEMMSIGIKQNSTNHSSSVLPVLDQLQSIVKMQIESSDFYKPFLNLPSTISSSEANVLQNKAKDAIKDSLYSSFDKIYNYLKTEYIPNARADIAATSLPNGKKYYEKCLKFHLSCDMSPEEVHNVGLREVKRISEEMKNIINSLGLDLTIQEFSNKIRSSPEFFYSNKKDLKKDYEKIVFEDIYPKLGKLFSECSIPKAKLQIKSLPESQAEGPLAFYLAGSYDGKRPGAYYVNDWNLKESPKYEMISLALHEAIPGHHLQCSFIIEEENVPLFRKIHEDRKYFSVPGRFAIFSAYGEGWALYCEYLGNELGLYKDPYSRFGQLSQEIFRSCRLVVDTGMHYFGWSREQAIKYMLENSAAAEPNVIKEVNRYVMWPGQACAYKIGDIKIRELRKRAEDQLGDKFDLKKFHHVVLEALGPLSFLEDKVNRFIAQCLDE